MPKIKTKKEVMQILSNWEESGESLTIFLAEGKIVKGYMNFFCNDIHDPYFKILPHTRYDNRHELWIGDVDNMHSDVNPSIKLTSEDINQFRKYDNKPKNKSNHKTKEEIYKLLEYWRKKETELTVLFLQFNDEHEGMDGKYILHAYDEDDDTILLVHKERNSSWFNLGDIIQIAPYNEEDPDYLDEEILNEIDLQSLSEIEEEQNDQLEEKPKEQTKTIKINSQELKEENMIREDKTTVQPVKENRMKKFFKSAFGGMCGSTDDVNIEVSMTMTGQIAVKNKEAFYTVAITKDNISMTEVPEEFLMDMPAFVMPEQYLNLKQNDIILKEDNSIIIVKQIKEGIIEGISLDRQELVSIIPVTNMFMPGMSFIRKVSSFNMMTAFNNPQQTNTANAPFGNMNPMMFMMMGENSKGGDMMSKMFQFQMMSSFMQQPQQQNHPQSTKNTKA